MGACEAVGGNILTDAFGIVAMVAMTPLITCLLYTSGTSWELMRSGCEHFGLYAQELSLTEAAVFGALEAGQPIICLLYTSRCV